MAKHRYHVYRKGRFLNEQDYGRYVRYAKDRVSYLFWTWKGPREMVWAAGSSYSLPDLLRERARTHGTRGHQGFRQRMQALQKRHHGIRGYVLPLPRLWYQGRDLFKSEPGFDWTPEAFGAEVSGQITGVRADRSLDIRLEAE
jgi:hypothetical protein